MLSPSNGVLFHNNTPSLHSNTPRQPPVIDANIAAVPGTPVLSPSNAALLQRYADHPQAASCMGSTIAVIRSHIRWPRGSM